MDDVDADDPRSAALTQLQALGLSAYAARTFVALTSLGEGTAQDVSSVSDVPRTRVYDAVEELERRGLVDVKQSTPKRFWAVSSETASRLFEQEYNHRVAELTAALDALEPRRRSSEQRGVWTVSGSRAVRNRTIELIDSASEEIVYMTVGDLLDDDLVTRLRAASDRGVDIKLASMEASVESELLAAVPDAELFDSMWVWSDTPAGRILMVDDMKTLASVLTADGDDPSKPRGETAIWGSGAHNSLVTLLRAMFTWQLRDDKL